MYSGMQTSGVPTLITTGTGNDGFLGGSGGIGALLIGALLGGGGIFGGFGRNGYGYGMDGGAARSAVATESVITPTLSAMQNQISGLSNQITSQGIGSEIDELESTVQNGMLSTLMGIKDNGNLYLQGTGQILTGQASNNFQTLSSLNSAVNTITTQNYNAALQNLNSFNQLNTTQLQSFNEMSRDNGNGFNALTMQLNNMSAQNAACLTIN